MNENPPYTLFQNEKGKWGTKDADGRVYDEPIYQRVEREDGSVIYFDGYTGVTDFNPETGMDLISWFQPWWEDAFLWAKYPDEYNDLLWPHIKTNRLMNENDSKQILALAESTQMTAEQYQTLSDIAFYCRWSSLPDNEDDCMFADEWFDSHHTKLTPQERVDCLVPLMQCDTIDVELKSIIWYANFCFIDTFLNEIKQNSI